ncbi:hypothetical protein HK096_005484 [Nowakowskiella sp. JEL0078]|nr:hypothetical protein HK096_005484 [Nowakowskiella sp. JEL0078]
MSSLSSAPAQQFIQNPVPSQISHYQPQQQYYLPVQMEGGAQMSTIQRGFPSLEKRATHNATERARREILNVKFQELANCIPALSNVRKPSKSVIVQKALEHVEELQRISDRKDNAIRTLLERNSNMRVEVGKLRSLLGHPVLPPENDQDVLSAISTIQFNSTQQNRMNYQGIRHSPHVVVYTTSLQGQGMGSIPSSDITNGLTPITPSTAPVSFDQSVQQNNFGEMKVNNLQQLAHSVNYTSRNGQNRSSSLSDDDDDDDGTLLNSSIPITTSVMIESDQQSKQGYEGDISGTFQSPQKIQTSSNCSSISNHNQNGDHTRSSSPGTNIISTPLTLTCQQSYSLDQSKQHQNIQIPTSLPIQNYLPKIIQTSYNSNAPAQMFTPLTSLPNQQTPQYLYNNQMHNTSSPEPMYMQHQQMQSQCTPQALQSTQIKQVHPQQLTYQPQFTPQNTIFVTPSGAATQNQATEQSHEARIARQQSFAFTKPQHFQTHYATQQFVQPREHILVSQQITQQNVIPSHGTF